MEKNSWYVQRFDICAHKEFNAQKAHLYTETLLKWFASGKFSHNTELLSNHQ